MSDNKELAAFYARAYAFCAKNFLDEVEWARSLDLAKTTPEEFLEHYARAVLSAGLREQGVNTILERVFENGVHPDVVKHRKKREAIDQARIHFIEWFNQLKSEAGTSSQLTYLGTLPGIGPTTRFHLAQNIGIDVAKPDRHLLRLSNRFGYDSDVQRMCQYLASENRERVTTIDKVLWRCCNMGQSDISS